MFGLLTGCSPGNPAFTFKPDGEGYEGIEITTNDEGKRVAKFIGGIPTYLRHDDKVYILNELGDGALTSIIPKGFFDEEVQMWAINVNFDEIIITIPSTVTKLGSYVFFLNLALIEIEIPNSITTLSDSTFRWCSNLKELTLSDSLSTIEKHAFDDCESLETINYRGTEDQFGNIDIDKWDNDVLDTVHINYEYKD